jgi:hypothetical protein
MRPVLVRVVPVLLGAFALGCEVAGLGPSGPPLAPNQVLASNATIRFVNLEGGCWVVVTSVGKYETIGLAPEFRQDGLAVYVVARRAPQSISACMIAPIVTFDTIRTR